ncbi:MAG: hypothetical protein LBN30_04145 [Oscillospiraceae bacterium]|jgi:hypothetical protein|nr:hypothetical protein [Oscillospiraceae bacterium]
MEQEQKCALDKQQSTPVNPTYIVRDKFPGKPFTKSDQERIATQICRCLAPQRSASNAPKP